MVGEQFFEVMLREGEQHADHQRCRTQP
jgi:hypothetical protein